MNRSLEPWTGGRSLSRQTGRELSRISTSGLVAQEREDLLARVADRHIANGAELVERAILRMAVIDSLVSQVSHDRPGFEMSLRILQENFAVGVGSTIREYIQR